MSARQRKRLAAAVSSNAASTDSDSAGEDAEQRRQRPGFSALAPESDSSEDEAMPASAVRARPDIVSSSSSELAPTAHLVSHECRSTTVPESHETLSHSPALSQPVTVAFGESCVPAAIPSSWNTAILAAPSSSHTSASAAATRTLRRLLRVNMRLLDPAREFARAFGVAPAAAARAGGGFLVTPAPDFGTPPSRAAGGFGMRRAADGSFAFDASDAYGAAHVEFEMLRADPTVGAGALEQFRHGRRGGAHVVTALLQQHDVLQATTGGAAAAVTELRRALHVLESSWHQAFRPGDEAGGSCALPVPGERGVGSSGDFDVLRWRLPVEWDASEAATPASAASLSLGPAMYAALHRQVHSASRTAAPRAGLELCKMLLLMGLPPLPSSPAVHSSSSSAGLDPCRALLWVGDLALRALQFEWLVDLTGTETGGCRLGASDIPAVMLPGVALARSLALMHVERRGGFGVPTPLASAGGETGRTPVASAGPGSAPVSLRPHDSEQQQQPREPLPPLFADIAAYAVLPARGMLARALLQFPHVFAPLVAGVSGGAPAVAAPQNTGAQGGRMLGTAAATAAAVEGPMLWAPLLAHPLFSGAGIPTVLGASAGPFRPLWPPPPALSKLVDIAVARHVQVWRQCEAMGSLRLLWLAATDAVAATDAACRVLLAQEGAETDEAAAHAATAFTAWLSARQVFAPSSVSNVMLLQQPPPIASAAAPLARPTGSSTLRSAPGAREAAVRHYSSVLIGDFDDKVETTVDAALLDGAGEWEAGVGQWQGDEPLPAAGEDLPGMRLGWRPRPLRVTPQHNPLVLFVTSLLPWNQLAR